MRVQILLGTRPEIIKLAPVVRELQRRDISLELIHTGQHFSYNMDQIFWDLFELPKPKFYLGIREKTQARQTAEMLRSLDDIFQAAAPNWLIVQGDTNSTLSGALAAAKFPSIKIAHVEAGLRSGDRTMPEEINRLICDRVSHILFPPTELAERNLIGEGYHRNSIFQSGNTIEDAVLWQMPRADGQSLFQRLEITPKKYILLTLHRAENTANAERLLHLIHSICDESARLGLHVVFPVHPRTQQLLQAARYTFPNHVHALEPIGYLEFLALEKGALVIATDSGGLQEEACLLKVPCLTLRENTERPETVACGANQLAGVEREQILQCFRRALTTTPQWESPYGGGEASRKIVDALIDFQN